jgi:hypothetical protein
MPESVENPVPTCLPLPSVSATPALGGIEPGPVAPDAARRDRDVDGRARQARPRDALGRPLPYGARGVEPVSEDPLPPLETVEVALGLLAEGRPFSAHEVFEARWKIGPEGERDLWQGLAQLCVAITHALRGNPVGAQTLLERGTQRLQQYAVTGGPTYGVVLQTFVSEARARITQ